MIVLPQEICLLLRDLVSDLDYACFLNTSKRYYANIRKATIRITLALPESWDFFVDPIFHARILSIIQNPYNQLKIDFRSSLKFSLTNNFAELSTFLTAPQSFYSLHVDRYFQFKAILEKFERIQFFEIDKGSGNNTINPKFPEVKRIRVEYVNEFSDFTRCSNLEYVHLAVIKIPDLVPLANVKKLEIRNCSLPDDLSPLKNIYSLSFHDCRCIKDISPLTNNQRISIYACDNVRDYQPISKAKFIRIGIFRRRGIDLTCLPIIHELHVDDGYLDCSVNFQVVQYLWINCSPRDFAIDFSLFRNIPSIEIDFMGLVSSLSGLGGTTNKLILRGNSQNSPDFSSIHGIPIVSLEKFYNLTDLSSFSDTIELELINVGVKNLHGLRKVRKLTLQQCGKIETYEGIELIEGIIQCLDVDASSYVMDLPGLEDKVAKLFVRLPEVGPPPVNTAYSWLIDSYNRNLEQFNKVSENLKTISWLQDKYLLDCSRNCFCYLKKSSL